jgi:hypothetical protein
MFDEYSVWYVPESLVEQCLAAGNWMRTVVLRGTVPANALASALANAVIVDPLCKTDEL